MSNTAYNNPSASSTMSSLESRQTPSQLADHTSLDYMIACFRDYSRENPESVALWCLGIGFVLGWKLKPW